MTCAPCVPVMFCAIGHVSLVVTRSDTVHHGMIISRRWTLKVALCFIGSSSILMDMAVPSVRLHPFELTGTNGVEGRNVSGVNDFLFHDASSSILLSCITSNLLILRRSSAGVPTQLFPGPCPQRLSSPSCMPARLQKTSLVQEGGHR